MILLLVGLGVLLNVMSLRFLLSLVLVVGTLALAACTKPPPPIAAPPPDLTKGGRYKIGNPYTIKGVTYNPKEEWNYEEVGIASWYGPNFHGRRTANGEFFDQNAISAAHRTLQMPSIVLVENLENNRTLVVRVNDRGPFAHDRILDLSRRGAQLLGFEQKGTALVKVRLLEPESRVIKQISTGERSADSAPELLKITSTPTGQDGAPILEGESVAEEDGISRAGLGVQEEVVEEPLESGAGQDAQAEPEAESITEEPIVEVRGDTEVLLTEEEAAELEAAANSTGNAANQDEFYVQVGSFRSLDNAEALAAELSEFGVASLQEAEVGGIRYHRVRLGPFASTEEASRLAASLAQGGYPSVQIVRQTPPQTQLTAPE